MLRCWFFSRLGVLVQCERKREREKKERRHLQLVVAGLIMDLDNCI